MRRQEQYADSNVNSYVSPQMQHASGPPMDHKSGHFQGQLEAFTPERDRPYVPPTSDGQWRWERDGSNISNPVASHMYNEGQRGDASISYYRGQRTDAKMPIEKQGNNNVRPVSQEEDMDIGYEDNFFSRTFEGLEQKFLDDIRKLTKEQNDAEDAENARHREKINVINAQYEEQLKALRTRRASRRDEILQRESNARQQQYQQFMIEHSNSGMAPSDPRGYNEGAPSAAVGESQRSYNNEHYDSYRDRARFPGNPRDQGVESRGTYPRGGRIYDIGSRYY